MPEEKKKASAAHMKATEKYEKKAYYRVLVRFSKNLELIIRQAAGESVNGYIVQAVKERLQRDGYILQSQAEQTEEEMQPESEAEAQEE